MKSSARRSKPKIMKTVPIKTHTTEKDKLAKFIDTIFLIKAVVENVPTGGVSTAEMRRRIKILDVVEAVPEGATELEFPDDVLKELVKLTEAFKWLKVDKFIIDFEDSLK